MFSSQTSPCGFISSHSRLLFFSHQHAEVFGTAHSEKVGSNTHEKHFN